MQSNSKRRCIGSNFQVVRLPLAFLFVLYDTEDFGISLPQALQGFWENSLHTDALILN